MTIQSLCHHATSILCLAGIAVASAACTAPADPGAIGGDDSGDSSGSSGSSSDDSGDDESSGGPAPASDATSGSSGGDSSGGDSSGGEGPSPEPEPEPQPGCVPTGNEWCNGLDDDCDDAVDEICPTDGALVTLSNEYMGGFYGLSAAGTSSPPQMADFDVAGDRARWIVPGPRRRLLPLRQRLLPRALAGQLDRGAEPRRDGAVQRAVLAPHRDRR
ncbi:MAG: hypothetical protein IPK74_11885 [Deltaproteobacteria bacterium]|nr:hypothetical protein [Deltaproteobacteria bacterium]